MLIADPVVGVELGQGSKFMIPAPIQGGGERDGIGVAGSPPAYGDAAGRNGQVVGTEGGGKQKWWKHWTSTEVNVKM